MQDYIVTLHRGRYAMQWREGGRQKRRSLGTKDKVEAHRLAREVDRLGDLAVAETFSIGELWRRYHETLVGKPAHTTMGYESRAVLPFWGDLLPADVTKAACERYAEIRRSKGRRDGTILTELNRLSSTLRHAVRQGWVKTLPIVTRPGVQPARERHLTKAEAKRFLAAIKKPHVDLFVRLALTTAARREALLGLTWDRVDLDRRLIQLRDPTIANSNKGRALVPIGDSVLPALVEARRNAGSPFVIEWSGNRVRTVKTALATACEISGVADVTANVFRHTAAVWMVEAGVSMEEVSQYLGHSSTQITRKHYARFSSDFLRGAVSALTW